MVALLLLMAAAAFLIASLFLACLTVMEPVAATLVTGLVLLLLGSLLLLTAGWPRRVPPRAPTAPGEHPADQLVPLIALAVSRKPMVSLGLALAAGAVAELTRRRGSRPGSGVA